jgi:acetolactate synthase-1/2/3 large subunit
MKASDLFLRCLENEGVRTIYGIPGEETTDLMMSLRGSSIEFVVCRHEQAAAFMADFQGRLTGRPGVCLSTLGPGATNLATGVASATLDHSPLVAIVGQASTRRLHQESHQNMDAIRMFEPISKWATSLRDADAIPETIHKAFKLASMEKPGAVVVELPEDIAREDTAETPIPIRDGDLRSGTEEPLVRQALSYLSRARAPIVLAGHGVLRMRAGAELARLVERTGLYVATTFMAKGALSDRNPHCLYTVGLGLRDIVLEAFEQADLVVCVGYDLVEWHPRNWNLGREKVILHLDSRPAETDRHYVPSVEIVGDIAASLRALQEACGPAQVKQKDQFSSLRERMTRDLEEFDQEDVFPARPQRVLRELRSLMADDDILISDVGAHKLWVARQYPTYAPLSCLISNGFCSMGLALPGAIAAKRLFPEKKVVALCGDGGFLMNVQDLITAVRYKTALTVLLWEDGQYGMIKWKQEMAHGRSAGVELLNPDFVRLAESFGCAVARPSDMAGVGSALKAAFRETSRPSVVVVTVDESENLKLTRHLGALVSR